MGSKPDQTRNEWFVQENSVFDVPQEKMSKQTMNDNFQRIKDQSNGLINYSGVQSLNNDAATNNNFYDDWPSQTPFKDRGGWEAQCSMSLTFFGNFIFF